MFGLPRSSKDTMSSSQKQQQSLIQLQKQVDSMTIHNYKILQKIQQLDPNYQYDLYEIKTNSIKQSAFKKQLLIKQKEKLVEEKKQLEKALENLTLSKESQGLDKYNQVNQYAFLRSTWSRFKGVKLEDCADRIEHLNKTICVLKNNIFKMTECQKNYSIMPQISCLNDQAYQKLKVNYERICMIHEDQSMLLLNKMKQIQNQKQINQGLKTEILSLKNQMKKNQTNFLSQKLKIARLEEKILILKDQIHDYEKTLKRIDEQQTKRETIQLFDSDKNISEIVYVNQSEKFSVKIICQQFLEKLDNAKSTSTSITLKELVQMLQKPTVSQEDISLETLIPKLPISTKSFSSQQILSDRFIITNDKTGKGNNQKYNSRTQRKVIALQKTTDNVGTKNRKFTRTGYNQSFQSTQDVDMKPLLQNKLKKATSCIPKQKFAELEEQLDKLNEINPEIKINEINII